MTIITGPTPLPRGFPRYSAPANGADTAPLELTRETHWSFDESKRTRQKTKKQIAIMREIFKD